MKISAKTEYACIAMLELAAAYSSGEPVRIGKIAETHGIPSRFLVQILLQLKGAGLVSSTRGAAGGYQLVKDPEGITLAQVMVVIEGQEERISSSCDQKTRKLQVLLETWQEVSDCQRGILESVTLADLLDRSGDANENMYYI